MRALAPAKVNLFLHVLGRRSDGYHLLDSLVVFAAGGDVLHAEPAETLSLDITGPRAGQLAASSENLVLRAARALAAVAGVAPRARLTLEKHLPVAAGIGGGSADAAAAWHLLSALWNVSVDPAAALALGADVPVCLAGRPARMRGIGDQLGPAPVLPHYGLALVNPNIAVATADVFRARTGPWRPAASLPPAWPDAAAMAADLARCHNDLQPPAIALCPAIADALAFLRDVPGCLHAAMSGSGATCYGLFATKDHAAAVARACPPHWWHGA